MKTVSRSLMIAFLGVVGLAATVHADGRQLVPRRIGVSVPDLRYPVPDFKSEEFIALIVQMDPFYSGDRDIQIIDLDGTETPDISTWALIPAQIVAKDGTKYSGTFYCELTPEYPLPPLAGSVTFLGPEGLVIDSTVRHISRCQAGGDCPGGFEGTWYFDPDPAGLTFVVLDALFLE